MHESGVTLRQPPQSKSLARELEAQLN